MAGEMFDIAVWEIENLSCWNPVLHGIFIESSNLNFIKREFKIRLYPRGISGLDDRILVYLSFMRQDEFSCDLSFIGADGSTFYTQHMLSKDTCDVELPPGPKLEEVIAKIRENESDRKDRLTLRFQIKNDMYEEINVCTIIRVFDATLEVNPSVRDNKIISFIRCMLDDYDAGVYLEWGKILDDKLELCIEPNTEDTILVRTRLRFLSWVGSLLMYECNEHVFHEEEGWIFSDTLTKRELSRENVKSLILDLKIISGTLTQTLRHFYLKNAKIISNRYVSVCVESSLTESKIPNAITHEDKKNSSACVLSKELMSLYLDQNFSDLKLKCGVLSFPVHRNILSARSTVFKTMLSTDRTEAASGCVVIGDLDPSTLSRFLAFLYTGAVENLEGESALKLYYAADKYLVPSLKTECVLFLSDNVSVSNVCDVLLLGDSNQDQKLIGAAHYFILRNYNEVLKSKEWNSFMRSEPILAVKTLTHFGTNCFVIGNLNALQNLSLV